MATKQNSKAVPTDADKAKRAAERADAFKRLAVKRVNKAIKILAGIGNLASYKPTLEQAKAVENALVKAHNDCVARLKGTAQSVSDFSL